MDDLDFFEAFHYMEDNGGTYFHDSDYFRKKIEKVKNENKNVSFKLGKNKKDAISKIIPFLEFLKEEGVDITKIIIGVEINANEQYLTTSELEQLIEVENYVKANGGTFAISAEELFTLDEIIIVNQKLQDQIDYINSLTVPDENNRPLNQLEKFIMAYNFCTNLKYNENEENKSSSRYITSIMTGEYVVCVGYAHLLKEMCHRLGIECFNIGLHVYNNKNESAGAHQNNIVSLDGKLYYVDACWDCVNNESSDIKSYNFCLIPMEDSKNFKRCKVKGYSAFSNLKEDKQIIKKALKQLQESEEYIEFPQEIRYLIIKYLEFLPNVDRDFKALNLKCDNFKQYMKLRDEFELKEILKLMNKYEYGEAISYDEFYTALYNINRAEGMDPRKAETHTTRTMEENEERAQEIFTPNASNCFVAGREKNYEL